jgi:hypothetical protein
MEKRYLPAPVVWTGRDLAQGERAFQTLINGARFLAAASALMLDFLALALLTEIADGQFVFCATLMWFGLLPAVNPIPALGGVDKADP